MIEGGAGLFSGLNLEANLQGLHFDLPEGRGDIGDIRLAMTADSRNDQVAAQVDMGVSDMALVAVPAQFAPLVPQRINVRFALAGIPADSLRHLLRSATAEGANPATLQAEAVALLNQPGRTAAAARRGTLASLAGWDRRARPPSDRARPGCDHGSHPDRSARAADHACAVPGAWHGKARGG
jgi:hypothetical protein